MRGGGVVRAHLDGADRACAGGGQCENKILSVKRTAESVALEA